MADVFLSYKREDRLRAKAVADAISQYGYSVFYDAAVDVGEPWNRRIQTEINASHCVVVLWSEHSCDIHRGEWVQNEARVGKQRDILAPALIDDCVIPLEFSGVQAADLRSWRGDHRDAHWQSFVTRIGKCLQRAPHVAPNQSKRWRLAPWHVGASVTVLLATGYGMWRLWPIEGAAPTPVTADDSAPAILPSESVQELLEAEWRSYLADHAAAALAGRPGICSDMVSWSEQYMEEYPGWELAQVSRDQTRRLCIVQVALSPDKGAAQTSAGSESAP